MQSNQLDTRTLLPYILDAYGGPTLDQVQMNRTFETVSVVLLCLYGGDRTGGTESVSLKYWLL